MEYIARLLQSIDEKVLQPSKFKSGCSYFFAMLSYFAALAPMFTVESVLLNNNIWIQLGIAICLDALYILLGVYEPWCMWVAHNQL